MYQSNSEMNVKPGEGYQIFSERKMLHSQEINIETSIYPQYSLQEMNYRKFLFPKFARYLLRQGITSVNVTKECFSFVPIQDFTENSDIDWSKSIAEIDAQLYKKYGLAAEEIDFIESMIKPM